MSEPLYSFYVFSDEQLASTVAGASGAKKIGVSAIIGISGSDVQAVLAELAARAGTSAASETTAGIVELASASETQAGTDNTRAVHPSGLASLTGTETRRGLLELATATETSTGTDAERAIHPAGLKSTLDSRFASELTPEAWISPTFQNGWVNYGAPFETAAYYKDRQGRVHPKGVVKSGSGTGAIFTLPVGYRPAATEPFITPAALNNTDLARIEVASDGTVNRISGLNTALSLSGISFRAA